MGYLVTNSAKLLVRLHGQGSSSVELERDCFTIGRKPDNDLSIDDHTVSSHHARVIRVQSVYFLEDLNSTNGTAVNGQAIERAQLHDADVITIGQHRMIFQDSGTVPTRTSSSSSGLDETMAIRSTSVQAGPSITARILINAGKTDQLEYQLTKPSNLIGSQDGAAIRLTGWFAPKAAAVISGRARSFTVSPSERNKPLLVNGHRVTVQQQLKDGDVIEVAGVSMTFYVVPPNAT